MRPMKEQDSKVVSLIKQRLQEPGGAVLAEALGIDRAELEGESQEGQAPLEPCIVKLADVEPEEVGWLWPPYIPLGKLTLLEGDPGAGKTFLALSIAAIVSRGYPFPDPAQGGKPMGAREPANVLYMTCEDGLADTLRPRLDAAGADVNHVYALTGKMGLNPETGQIEELPVWLSNVEVLREALRQVRPALVVVDPLQGFLGSGIDMHRANEVRPILSGLGKLAEEFSCAVLLIRHLGKSQQDRAVYRGLGSIDFAAAARSILLAAVNPRNPRERVLAHVKSSLAPAGASIGYELMDNKVQWTGVSALTPQELLAPEPAGESKSELDEAKSFLEELLADGPVAAKQVKKEAGKADISEPTLRRAKQALGVKVYRESMGNKGEGEWYWKLPQGDQDDQPSKNTQMITLRKVLNPLSDKGSNPPSQDDHVITLRDHPRPLEPQAIPASLQDDHQDILRGKSQDDHADPQNRVPSNGSEWEEGTV